MNIIRNLTGYRMSRDYALLWNLAQKQSVVCVCDYGQGTKCRDVAQTISHEDGNPWVGICARGIEYVSAENLTDFARRCARESVEFIVPETAVAL